MPTQMVQPKINEVSGVDHPAHLTEGWLMMKDASPETVQLLIEAEAIAKGVDPTTLTRSTETHTGSENMATLTEEQRAALPADVAGYVKSLEDDAAANAAAAITKSVEDTDAAAFEKSVASLPEPVRKAVIQQQKDLAEQRAITKSLFDASENTRFEAMAKELYHLPGVGPDGAFAQVMRKAADSNPAAFESIFTVLKGADAAMKESGFFKEIGTAAVGEGSGEDKITAMAKQRVAADTTGALTFAKAVTDVAMEHPELYADSNQGA